MASGSGPLFGRNIMRGLMQDWPLLVHKIIDFALEVAGPSALRKEHGVARAFRHARSRRIVEGPSEIQRHIIQRALFRARGAGMNAGCRQDWRPHVYISSSLLI